MRQPSAITIGQSPRLDITSEIVPLLRPRATLIEAGALDGLNGKAAWARVLRDTGARPG